MPDPFYPLKFEPIYKAKAWGGRRLETIGRELPPGEQIGESWEICDLASSSPSGGGGGPERSIISNGPLAGTTLNQLLLESGPELMGSTYRDGMDAFPLLAKVLNPEEQLSLQVHPNEAYVQKHPDAFLKNEAWCILDAGPDGTMYTGVKPGTDRDAFRSAVESGNTDGLLAMLQSEPAMPGKCHHIQSGTLHAGGGGVLAFEVQTPSDTTFRVYDWGRTDRELHIEQAMECIDFDASPPAPPGDPKPHADGSSTAQILADCEYFRITRVQSNAGADFGLGHADMAIWHILEGTGEIDPGNGTEAVAFQRGETLLIPAGLDAARVRRDVATRRLEVTVP